jgi:hypothetical protein
LIENKGSKLSLSDVVGIFIWKQELISKFYLENI